MSLLSRILLMLRDLRARAQPPADFVPASALRATPQNDRFRQVFHASTDSIAIVRLDNDSFVEVNEGYEQLSGYTRAEVIGQAARAEAWVNPAQRSLVRATLLREGRVRDQAIQFRRRNGEVRDCVVNATLIALDRETPDHAVWITRDVTQEHAVNEQFIAAFRLTPDFMSISRLRDGQYVEVNQAFERIMGYRREEVIGHSALELGIWRDPDRRQVLSDLLGTSDVAHEFPIEVLTRNGVVRQALANCSVFEARGERYMIALLRDVTEAQRAEKALRDSETKLMALFNASPTAVVVSDPSQGYAVLNANETWERQFGYAVAECKGLNGAQLGIWDCAAARQLALNEVELTGQIQGMDAWMVRRDGQRLLCRITGRRIQVGGASLLIMAQDDVTEQRRIQQEIVDLNLRLEQRVGERTQQLQQANAELSATLATLHHAKDQLVHSEKLAALGALVAGVAHELNTPIGNGLTVATTMEHHVKAFSVLMDQRLKRSDLERFVNDTGQAAEILIRNLTRAGTLVSSFKQVAVDQTSSQRRQFNVREIVSEIVLTLNPTIRASGCDVATTVDDGLWLDSYPGPLGQALTNLINNAIIHGFGAGRKGRIDIVARGLGADLVEIAVRDHGKGINADDLRRIFDPFFTTRLGQGGSGLGLHIVHNIVTGLLGGQVAVTSQLGEGAAFTLHLPRRAPATAMAPDEFGAVPQSSS
ncbi:PAS domain S-box protein [Rhodoferax sp.]|uniref:PAS domain-containing sensor histidine kinase n=1 Tax=Rhodoferax sp. TaxID=50421 RepID=UPI00274B3AA6|nr:PAS domain S-box protein [Rhodoferax sp.]